MWIFKKYPERRWTIIGALFGATASLLGYLMYMLGYLAGMIHPYIGLVFVGLSWPLMMHSAIGYNLAIMMGIIKSAMPVVGIQYLWVEMLSSFCWICLYGGLGIGIDRLRKRRFESAAH